MKTPPREGGRSGVPCAALRSTSWALEREGGRSVGKTDEADIGSAFPLIRVVPGHRRSAQAWRRSANRDHRSRQGHGPSGALRANGSSQRELLPILRRTSKPPSPPADLCACQEETTNENPHPSSLTARALPAMPGDTARPTRAPHDAQGAGDCSPQEVQRLSVNLRSHHDA
jgi:hypothetical protein